MKAKLTTAQSKASEPDAAPKEQKVQNPASGDQDLLSMIASRDAKIKKYESEINFLIAMVSKQSKKLVAAETLIPKYQKELSFLVK